MYAYGAVPLMFRDVDLVMVAKQELDWFPASATRCTLAMRPAPNEQRLCNGQPATYAMVIAMAKVMDEAGGGGYEDACRSLCDIAQLSELDFAETSADTVLERAESEVAHAVSSVCALCAVE